MTKLKFTSAEMLQLSNTLHDLQIIVERVAAVQNSDIDFDFHALAAKLWLNIEKEDE